MTEKNISSNNSNSVTCNVIRDLMPLAADGVASQDSLALVKEHIAGCPECGKVYRDMTEGNSNSPAPTNDKRFFTLIRRRFLVFIAAIMCIGAIIGVNFTASEFMFRNFLLMPAVGALSYICLKYRGAMISAVVFGLSVLRGFVSFFTSDGDSPFDEAVSYIPLGMIYAFLVLLGFTAALLFAFAFRKNETKGGFHS